MNCEIVQPNEYEILLYSKNTRHEEKIPYTNRCCEFKPCGWAKINGKFYPLGYKVVTKEMKSLGLRKNPNIMTFPVNEWVTLTNEEIMEGKNDWGGIWTALHKNSIQTLKNYMKNSYGIETRAFLTAMYEPLYANSYRIKSQGVILLKEII